MLSAPRRLRIEKDVVTRIYRNLKGKGQLNVSVGQQVTPSEIIGTCQVPSGFRTLNLSSLLGVAAKDVAKYLKRNLGQRIYKDELLAYKRAFLFQGEKVVTAPTDGVLDLLNTETGELKMSLLPKKEDLPAGVYGVVEKVDKEHGQVVIRTQVSKIYGLFGTGKSRDGILHILTNRDSLVGASMISQKLAEHIIVGGSLIYKEAISAAISQGINGIISGGINAKDYRGMAGGRLVFPKKFENDIGISVVICEGFGSIPIGWDIYEMLLQYEGKFVLLDGNFSMIILPSYQSNSLQRVKASKLHAIENQPDLKNPPVSEIKIGSQVRVVGATYTGEQGKVLAINKSYTLLDSKIWAYLLTIETKSRKIQIPSNNIELI